MKWTGKWLRSARLRVIRSAGSLQGIVAIALISIGAGLVYLPAGLIVAGALILIDKVL